MVKYWVGLVYGLGTDKYSQHKGRHVVILEAPEMRDKKNNLGA